MKIKDAIKELRNMVCDIAEVIISRDSGYVISTLVYLVDKPSSNIKINVSEHDWIYGCIEDFENRFIDEVEWDFNVYEFDGDDLKDESKTIRWYKVKCSFFKEELGIKKWCDVVDFLSHNIGFDYVITAQYTEPYKDVEGYYENGEIYKL